MEGSTRKVQIIYNIVSRSTIVEPFGVSVGPMIACGFVEIYLLCHAWQYCPLEYTVVVGGWENV